MVQLRVSKPLEPTTVTSRGPPERITISEAPGAPSLVAGMTRSLQLSFLSELVENGCGLHYGNPPD
jgi:hypothetical protein